MHVWIGLRFPSETFFEGGEAPRIAAERYGFEKVVLVGNHAVYNQDLCRCGQHLLEQTFLRSLLHHDRLCLLLLRRLFLARLRRDIPRKGYQQKGEHDSLSSLHSFFAMK